MEEENKINDVKEEKEIEEYFNKGLKRKIPIGLILIIIILLVIGGALYYYFIINSPKNVFLTSVDSITQKVGIKENTYTKINTEYKLNIDIQSLNKQEQELYDIINDIALSGTLSIDYQTKLLHMNLETFYKGKDLIETSAYLQDNNLYLDIFDKKLSYALEDEEDLDELYQQKDYETEKKVVISLKNILINNLKKAEYTREYTKLNDELVDKITLIVNKTLVENIYNDLINDQDFINGYAKINDMSTFEAKNDLKDLFESLDDSEGYISIYLSLFHDQAHMLEIYDGTDKLIVTNKDDEYNYKLYENSVIAYEGTVYLKLQDDNGEVSLYIEDINERINIRIDYMWNIVNYDVDIPKMDITDAIPYEEITEEDTNEMMTNALKNENLLELIEEIIELYNEEEAPQSVPTQTT